MATCVNQCAKYVRINERFIFIQEGVCTGTNLLCTWTTLRKTGAI